MSILMARQPRWEPRLPTALPQPLGEPGGPWPLAPFPPFRTRQPPLPPLVAPTPPARPAPPARLPPPPRGVGLPLSIAAFAPNRPGQPSQTDFALMVVFPFDSPSFCPACPLLLVEKAARAQGLPT